MRTGYDGSGEASLSGSGPSPVNLRGHRLRRSHR